jgi:hypothetical protein
MHHTRHSIHRQSLEVSFEQPGQEPGLQDRLATVYYQRILPKLNSLFDEFDHVNLTIPELMIDCGVLHEANWEQELTDSVVSLLSNELRAKQRAAQYEQQHLQQQTADELMYFLRKGRFQWDTWNQSIADLETLLKLDDSLLDKLIKTLRSSTNAIDRFFFYFSDEFIHCVAGALFKYIPQEGVEYIAFLKEAGVKLPDFSTYVIKAYLAYRSQPTALMSFPISLTSMVWPAIDAGMKAKAANQIALAVNAAGNDREEGEVTWVAPKAFLNGQFIASFSALISNEFPELVTVIRRYGRAKAPKATDSNRSSSIEKVARERKSTAEYDDVPGTDDTDTYYISNAGLVIAYPFIETLLQRVGLIDVQVPFAVDSQRKASVMLQQLVTESPVTEEAEITLNKILCGLQPESFVDPTLFAYTATAKQECEAVLHAIIEHWNVLRNTSIDGLRETFLQRAGKIRLMHGKWMLQVDSHGTDVLLSSLPWSIGVIKLPWMSNMLYVEWTS